MSRAQLLRTPALGLSLCLILLLTTPSLSQSCRSRTTLQRSDLDATAQQELAADQAEPDEDAAAADQAPSTEELVNDGRIERQLPAELEELLATCEQKCSQIQSLRGTFMRYVYDSVFNKESRANGAFWYRAPDRARLDFRATSLPAPPVNPDKLGSDGEPFVIEAAENLKWIYTGEEVFIIHEDQEVYEQIQIPLEDQGRGIVLKPFPLPIGMPFPGQMTADGVKEQYHLSLGDQHRPEGRVIERDGNQIRLRPQLHVVAQPKVERNIRDWSRWEVLLDADSFLPRAIRLLDPAMTTETVYVFDLSSMRVNDLSPWDPSPFNARPPHDFNRLQ